jgi:glycosyltransferase involved in cell wall biosynthesis
MKTPHKLSFRIAGEVHPELRNAFDFMNDSVDYLGYLEQSELLPYIQQADLGLLPVKNTLWNNSKFPVKTVEMLAVGLPVLASKNSEASNIITHEEEGFLKENDADEWARLLDSLCKNKDNLSGLYKQARQKAVNEHSMESLSEYTINLINRLTDL